MVKHNVNNFKLMGCTSSDITDDIGNWEGGLIDGDSVIFPAPNPSPLLLTSKDIHNVQFEKSLIPILFIPCVNANKVIIYLHGNSEDIGHISEFLTHLAQGIKAHVVAIEYPGYGLYKSKQKSSEKIESDCEELMNYLIANCKVPVERIIIVGRSIGTGPAAILASKYKAMCVILISAYKSIKEVGMNMVGTIGYFLLKQKWPIISVISKVECPILLIHGKKDILIPYSHSVSLHGVCRSGESQLLIFDDMDHNNINYEYHIRQPFNRFIGEVDKAPDHPAFTFIL